MTKDQSTTKQELLKEISSLKKRIHDLEHAELERKRMEETLLSESEFNRIVIENAGQGICVCHGIEDFPYVRFTVWNECMTLITGYSMDEINRLGWYQSMYPDPAVQERAIIRMQSMRVGEDIQGEEWEITRADEQKRQLLITTRLYTDSKGEPLVLGVMSDITERKRVEKTLQESEDRFRTIIDKMPLGISLIDIDGRYEYVNPSFVKIFGYDLSDIPTGKEWFRTAYPDPEYRREVIANWKEDVRSCNSFEIRPRIHKVKCKEDTFKTILFRQVTLSSGKQLITYEDITDRISAEEALRKSEERYKSLVENAGEAIYVAQDGMLKFVNRAGIEIAGYSEQELISKPFIEFVYPDDRAMVGERYLKRLKDEGLTSRYTFRFIAKNGDIKLLELGAALIDFDGRPATLNLVTDVTERKRTEEGMRESEKRFRELAELLPETVYEADTKGTLTFVNLKAFDRFGYTQEDFAGGLNVLDMVTPDERGRALESTQRIMNSEDISSNEYTMLRKDGSTFPALIYSTVIINNGKPAGLRGFIVDITERKRTEEESTMLASVIRHSREIVNLATPNGTMLFLNDTGKKMLGISEEDVTQTNILSVIPEHLLDKVRQEVLPSIAEDGYWEGDLQYLNLKTGGLTDVHAITYKIADPETGAMQFMANVSLDITERKRSEEALQESENKFKSFAEHSLVGIYLIQDDIFKYVNPKFAEIFGYTIEECLNNMHFRQLVYPEDFDIVQKQVLKRATGEIQSVHYGFRGMKKTGEIIHVEIFGSSIMLDGRPTVTGTMLDITEQKHAEVRLQESEERYKALFERSLELVFLCDFEGNFIDANDAALELLGYTNKDIKSLNFPSLLPDDQIPLALEMVDVILKTGSQKEVLEFKLRRKDGEYVYVESMGAIIYQEGKPYAIQGIARNVTDRKLAEEEKRSLVERLQRAEKMESLGLMAGGVAHDLNNVLGIVIGYAEMLLMGADKSSTIRSKLENIMDGGQKAAAIVQDLLTLARRGVSARNILNLNKIIADNQKSPEFVDLLFNHSAVKIKTDLEPELLNISGSSVHLGKTIFNLVSNAGEAMKKGGFLTIKTANQYLDKPIQGYDEIQEGDYVVLSVLDTGEGIHEADLKRIFEPFYTKKVMGRSGTGLGLAVVWGTVKDHNGYINVESEVGKGSVFTLYFPVTREELSAEHIAVSISEYMGKGESILVVDDVRGQRDLAEEMLRKLNYSATSVSSGEEALAYLKEHKADLIVLDMIMDPGMDGLDTYRSVLEIRPEQKAIIVSGFSESDRVKSAQALGAGAYLKKPYVIEKLGLAVRRELDRSK